MIRTFLAAAAALACATMAPATLQAQEQSPAVVAAIDAEHIFGACAQCRVANEVLRARVEEVQARAAQLSAPLETEGRALQALVAALPEGSQPDRALAARLVVFQRAQTAATRDIEGWREQLRRDVESARAQIAARVRSAMETVMRRHGATDFVLRGDTPDGRRRIDITAEVLALVDQNREPIDLYALPPVSRPARSDRR